MVLHQWTLKEQAVFLKRIGMLLDRGYTLNEALEFIIIHLKRSKAEQLIACTEQLKAGESFYSVLSSLRFHPTAISYVFYGESNGQLSGALLNSGEILWKRDENFRKLKSLLVYPLFLFIFTIVMFFLFQIFVLPQFLLLYQSFQAEPNYLIRLLMRINENPHYFLFTILLFTAFLIFLLQRYKSKNSAYEIQTFLSKIPILGKILRLWNTFYFSYQFSQLLKNGISLTDSLKLMANDPANHYLSNTMTQLQNDLMEGYDLPTAIEKIPFWEVELAPIIKHGQLSGKLETELETYSQICFELFSEKVGKVISLLQPLIFSMVGIWILFMYFSIMMPSFQIMNSL